MSSKGYVLHSSDGSVPGVITILATVTGVNLKNTGQTLLYLAPLGHSVVITDIKVYATVATAVVVVPSVRVGKAPSYNEWCGITPLTGLNTAGDFVSLDRLASVQAQEAFLFIDQVLIDVTTGATATTLTGNIYVEGYLI